MLCEKFKKLSVLYLYDELDQNSKEKFENHLQECSGCARFVRNATKNLDNYRAIPVEIQGPPSSLLSQIPTRQKAQPKKAKWKRLFTLPGLHPVFSPALTALAVIIILLVYILPEPNQNTTNPDDLAWDAGLQDSLTIIQTKINDIQTGQSNSPEYQLYDDLSGIVQSYTEQRMKSIESEIDRLYREWSSNSF